jgi:hypothetical protein
MRSIDISNAKLALNLGNNRKYIEEFLLNPFVTLHKFISNNVIVHDVDILKYVIQSTREDKDLHDLEIVIFIEFVRVINKSNNNIQVEIREVLNLITNLFDGFNVKGEIDTSSCIITIKSSDKVI